MEKNILIMNLFEEPKLICNKIAGSESKTNFELQAAINKNFIIKRNKRYKKFTPASEPLEIL